MRLSSELRKLSVLFWMAVILVSAEVGLEYRAYQRGYAPLLFGAKKKPAVAAQVAGKAVFGPVAEFPFRSRIVPPEKDAQAVRIWISSSSYGEDERVPAGQIFPNLMEDLLRAQHKDVQVLNASRAGETVPTNAEKLSQGAPRWRPDIVVLYQMANDVNGISKQSGPVTHDKTPAVSDGEAHSLWDSTPEQRLVEGTTLYEQANNLITTWVSAQGLLSNGFTDAQVAEFDRRIRGFVSTAKASGVTPVLSTFATSYVKKQWPNVPNSVRDHVFQFNRVLSVRGWLNTVDRLNGVIRNVAAEERIQLIDLSAELAGHPELFRDFYHFSLEGHRRAAAVLAEGLCGKTAPAAGCTGGAR